MLCMWYINYSYSVYRVSTFIMPIVMCMCLLNPCTAYVAIATSIGYSCVRRFPTAIAIEPAV